MLESPPLSHLEKRLRFCEAVNRCTQELLDAGNLDAAIQQVLKSLLDEAEVDRVYVFREHKDSEGVSLVSQTHEACAAGIESQLDNPDLQNLSWVPLFQRWLDCFMRHEPIFGHVADYPEGERDMLAAQQIQSLLVVPIRVPDVLLGFVGFDSVRAPREWDETEVSLLQSVASVMGSLWRREDSQRRLRGAYERLERFDQISPFAIIEWCPGFTVMSSNATADRMFGYEPGEMLGQTSSALVPGFQSSQFGHGMWPDMLAECAPAAQVRESRRKDGTSLLCRWHYAVLRGALGEVERVLTIAEDVTEEVAIQARYQALFEQGLDGVVYHEENGEIIHANHAACKILGLTLDQLRGRASIDPGWKYVRPDGTDLPSELHPSTVALRTGGAVHGELVGVFNPATSDHTWILINAIPQFRAGDSRPFQVFTMFRDVSEHQEVVCRLRESEQTFRLFAENLADGIWIRNLETGEPIFHNQAVEKILGVGTFFSDPEGFLGLVPTQYRDDVAGMHSRYLRGEPFEVETPIVRPDGQVRWIQARGFPIPSELGSPHLAGVLRDVTERREVIEEITKARDRAEELSRLKSALISNMSHELRTPLTGIFGFVGLLESRLEDDEEGREYLSFVENSATRLHHTLEAIMEYSVIDSRKMANNPRVISLKETFQDLLERYRHWATAKGLDFYVEWPDADVLQGDPAILKTILKHLLDNSLKFTKRGGVRIAFRWSREDLIIKVGDTGIGIPQDQIPKVFEEFRQLSEGMSRMFEGNGLGLSIVKKYVDLLQGRVVVESVEGEATAFTVALPLDALGGADANPALRSRRILYVEHDAMVQLMGRLCLADFQVDAFATAEAALEGTEGNAFAAVLMELDLGREMCGLELCRELRERPEFARVPIAAVTAQTIDSESSLRAAGFTHYLRKPFTRKELLSLVNEMIRPRL